MGMKYLRQEWCGDSMFNKKPSPGQQLKLICKEIDSDSYGEVVTQEIFYIVSE